MIKSRHYCLTVKEPCQCKQEFQTVHRPPVLGGIVCSFKASQETPERRIYLQVVVRCWKCSQILQVKWEPPRPTIPSLLELPISMYHIFHLSLPFASHDPTGFSMKPCGFDITVQSNMLRRVSSGELSAIFRALPPLFQGRRAQHCTV